MMLRMVCTMKNKSYADIQHMDNFGDRLNYLMLLDGNVSSPRRMSNRFYKTNRTWQLVREAVLKRDLGMDLGINGMYIPDKKIIHHINPITEEDIVTLSDKLFDMDNLITVSVSTHNIIHYGKKKQTDIVERRPNDTRLW